MSTSRRLPIVALLTAGAGATHLAAAVPHFSPDALFGVSFVTVGWVQLACAVLLLVRPGTPARAATMAVNVAALGGWLLSRTTGLPLGHPGVEPVAVADAITVAFELAASGLLAARWTGWRTLSGYSTGALGAVGVALLLATGGSTAAIASLQGGHGDSAGGHGDSAGGHAAAGGDHHQQDAAPRGASPGAPAHRHADGSWHLHDGGEPHEHADGTVHVHAAAEGPAPSPPTPQPTPGDGHDHSHTS